MSKIRTSVFAKVLAWILIAVSGMGFLGSGLAVICMQQAGMYGNSLSKIREEQYARYSDRYSAMVLDYLENDKGSGVEYFADKNFRYGILQVDSYTELKRMNLSDSSIYVENNFSQEELERLALEDLHVFQCAIKDGTEFAYSNPESLWGYYWIHNTGGYWNSYEIERYVYDYHTGVFYCKANDVYYPIPNVLLHLYSGGSYVPLYLTYDGEKSAYLVDTDFDYEFQNDSYTSVFEMSCYGADIEGYIDAIFPSMYFDFSVLDELEVEKGEWAEMFISNYRGIVTNNHESTERVEVPSVFDAVDVSTEVTVNGTAERYSSWIDIIYEDFGDDAEYEQIVKNKAVRIDPDGYVRVNPKGNTSTNYFVVSYVPKQLVTNGEHWTYGDLFVKFEHVFGAAYHCRYEMIVVMLVCLLIYILAFASLCCMAGHRKGQSELVEGWTNKIPLEIYAAVTVAAQIMGIWVLDALSYQVGNMDSAFWLSVGAVVVLLMGLLLTAMVLEIITRIKLHTLLKRSICGWLLNKFFGGCKKMLGFVRENFSMVVRIALGFVIFCMMEFVLVALLNGGEGFALLLLLGERALLFIALLSVASQLSKLKFAGKQVASGDLNYKVDTTNMFWDFKQHGEHLNSIGDGLSVAVDERMKSEHFKTELITNVSHDIKTPLTSIINYVDLLQKEEIENENAAEYLEVLSRQSARLKKLLEDLLEASKASAGTLPVEFEVLEAGVFMVQTVGEFEEKTSAQQLELIIKKPEEPIYIKADGRHFWRVIDNLMNNICKYAQPGTRVYINLEATEKDVVITFRNTSRYPLNITSEELMERFVRGDSSRNTEGSGLGLSIAQSLMELMRGKFDLFVDGDLFKVVLTFERCTKEVS